MNNEKAQCATKLPVKIAAYWERVPGIRWFITTNPLSTSIDIDKAALFDTSAAALRAVAESYWRLNPARDWCFDLVRVSVAPAVEIRVVLGPLYT